MQDKSIDIIYCYRNRDTERVKRSLDSLSLQTDNRFHVIFIDYGSDESRSAEIKKLCSEYAFCEYVFVDTRGKLWNRSDALNHGFARSKAEFVFTSDIDMAFLDSFISFIHKAATPDVAKFFSVGYLSEQATIHLDLKKITSVPYVKSETFALGMVLVSKEIINKVNGYNAFYALWGTEDNDLKDRIDKSGYKTEFMKEILMLHQYHLPSSTDHSVLPEGWLQFLKDYYDHSKKTIVAFRGLKAISEVTSRPAKDMYFNAATVFEEVHARRLFIRHLLITGLLYMTSGEGRAYKFYPEELETGTFFKMKKGLNKFFRLLKFPLEAHSSHRDQYVSLYNVRDEIYFILKSLEDHIEDYYFELKENSLNLVVIKK